MPLFLTVALIVYGSMHLYAFGKAWRVLPHSRTLKLALIFAGLVLTVSPFLVRLLERQDWHSAAVVVAWVSYLWMGYVLLFFCAGLLIDLCRGAAKLLNLRWPLNETRSFSAAGLLAFILLGIGWYEAQNIQVEQVTITTPKLASGQVTIAQISDLHLGLLIGDRFLDRVVAKLGEIKPDIVVATGDIVDGQGDRLNSLARHFHAFRPRHGAYAVTGNHEYYVGLEHSLRFLRNAGFTVLRAESAKAAGIVLAGVDDRPRGNVQDQEFRDDVRQALASVSRQDFVILLKHRPIIDANTPFDLQLSGHTHGGQIFPFSYPTRLINGVPTGLIPLGDGRQLYVSRGVGTWGPPIRLFAEPEITLFTIKSSKE
ncbi:MAG: putative metallophosphoesterase [Betaproteobacteria bacterium ADurb.Bin341]|nr:MAG: putative metallophosphoesterase [Betaproteobacteria bacterium ADurb.Bin341]